ncbi:hypothetical protein [Klebsiella grimontii]|uniref:hypothetical protein n=1 Tax=Klebsiella grimontii TaxID=2058152 RepID=UPI001865DBC5|nr:hypothetical protein [Klebsiella grimontii]
MKLSQLTFLGFYLNGAQGSGRYDFISIEDIKSELERKTLFPYLKKTLGNDIDISILTESEKEKLNDEWLDISLVIDESRKLCVEKGGLCLLNAYILESIQRLNHKKEL